MDEKLKRIFDSLPDDMAGEIADMDLTFSICADTVSSIRAAALIKAGLTDEESGIIQMKNIENNKQKDPVKKHGKRFTLILIAAVLATALTATALAYSGVLRFFRVSEEPGAEAQAAEALDVLNNFAGEETGMESNDTALQYETGETLYFYERYESAVRTETAYVNIGDDGVIYWLDLRDTYGYSEPENCPARYISTGWIRDGEEKIPSRRFNADLYLNEVAYPDLTDYIPLAEDAAYDAMAELLEGGFIDADLETIQMTVFDMFNGGAANVYVLMENGDAYRVFLHPDDFTCIGFILFTPEILEAGNGPKDYLDALRNGTTEEYEAAQAEAYAGAVG